jgi:small conductance mechanosensitive channel
VPDAPTPAPQQGAGDLEPVPLDALLSTLTDTVVEWGVFGAQMLPNALVALVVLVVSWFASRVLSKVMGNAVGRLSDNQQVTHLATVAARIAVFLTGVFIALSVLNLSGVVTSLLAGVGVIGLALGFAFQDIAANFIAGVLMALVRPFQLGDLIRTGDHFGVVERVDLRATELRSLDGDRVLIPNRDVYNAPIVNYTETPHRRVEVTLGVAYSDDLRRTKEVVEEALRGVPHRIEGREPAVVFDAFGGSSIDFRARVWVSAASQSEFLSARSEAIVRIKEAMDAAGLHIPFPIRTLDFGAESVGGERLDTVLRPVFGNGEQEAAEG